MKIVSDLKEKAAKRGSDKNQENIKEFLKQFEDAVVNN